MLGKYKDHPSIKLIKAKNSSKVFKFRQIGIEEVKKTFQSLDPKKAAQKDDIKTNLLKKNDSSRSSKFPKLTSYLHIKKSKLSKEN